MKTCKVDGCKEKYLARGYCDKHYQQVRYHGKILKRTLQDPNEIIIKGDIAEVVLSNQKHLEVARTIIDAEDVEKIKKYKWHLDHTGYVTTGSFGRWLRIHHVIMGIKASRKTPNFRI